MSNPYVLPSRPLFPFSHLPLCFCLDFFEYLSVSLSIISLSSDTALSSSKPLHALLVSVILVHGLCIFHLLHALLCAA